MTPEMPDDQIRKVAKLLDEAVPVLDPGTWAGAIKDQFLRHTEFFSSMAKLEVESLWTPTGENYAEPVAWAKLLGVTIYTNMHLDMKPLNGDIQFHLFKGPLSENFPACSPRDLIARLRVFNARADQEIHETTDPAER